MVLNKYIKHFPNILLEAIFSSLNMIINNYPFFSSMIKLRCDYGSIGAFSPNRKLPGFFF